MALQTINSVKSVIFFLFCIVLASSQTNAQDSTKTKSSNILESTSIGGQWFLSNEYSFVNDLNQFRLKRGYFTVKTQLDERFSVRYTQDITMDMEGEDMGNVEIRLKYLYLAMDLWDKGFLKHMEMEFGMIHKPWLDFEQSINPYRVQGYMFAERNGINSSADLGVGIFGLFGGKMDKHYRKNVSNKYAGRYGSYALGIYNGPGYHTLEVNNNKTVEGRLSIRPLPDHLPGLQASYAFAYGKANIPDNLADFNMNIFFISNQTRYFTFTAQYLKALGNPYGDNYYFPYQDITNAEGVSLFGELKFQPTNFAVFARYDSFKKHLPGSSKPSNPAEDVIFGIAYRFLQNKIILDFDSFNYHKYPQRAELAIEIKF
ncbi:MAG: hypothetical protein R6T91_01890 [Bacteroidales bacterium]